MNEEETQPTEESIDEALVNSPEVEVEEAAEGIVEADTPVIDEPATE